MITPVIRGFDCTDIAHVESWIPAENEPISYWMTLHLGTDDEAVDYFQVRIASPDAMFQGGPKVNEATIVVQRSGYCFAEVYQTLESIVAACARPSWNDCALALSRHFSWEYEGTRGDRTH